MRKLHQILPIFIVVALCTVSCEKKEVPEKSNIPVVSQFVYDGMSMYYLWDEQMKSKEPTEFSTDPKKYFESVLYGQLDKWSWITDDVDDLLNRFSGEAAAAYGFSLIPIIFDNPRLIVAIPYVYPNTPAAEAKLKRGDVFWEIDGRAITGQNLDILYDANREITLTVIEQDDPFWSTNATEPINPRRVTITPGNFNTNPVLHTSIHAIEDNKKIGYLFYTGFFSNFNESLYNAFIEFRQAGVTDLVLDLRYNPGGDVSAAVYLASMIAPRDAVEKNSVFAIMQYNQYINRNFRIDGNQRLGRFRADHPNPINANLNLDKVYIITSRRSASASELITFCLRPYLTVAHIHEYIPQLGEKTAGKYTASWTVHAFDNFTLDIGGEKVNRAQTVYGNSQLTAAKKDELKNWAMQPIVARYTDRDGNDFSAQGGLVSPFPVQSLEGAPHRWGQIGDREEYLFAKAISLITDKPYRAAVRSASDRQLIQTEFRSQSEELLRRAVHLDNVQTLP
jgi:C-terminal processing protease CtpA/Prc